MNEFDIVEKQKELRYITVYNKLFKLITENIFPEGSKLPSEPELSKSLGVSRATLRQSLALLQDDGLVNNIRGKGNFIVKSTPAKNIALETISHPVYKCINAAIDDVEIQTHIEPSTDYINKIFMKKSVAVVLIDRWYKSQGNTVAYSFTILPIETVAKFDVDLNNSNKILNFVEKEIYNSCSNILMEIKYSASGNFATKAHPITSDSHFNLIQETIYDETSSVITSNKHYIPLKSSSIKFNLKK